MSQREPGAPGSGHEDSPDYFIPAPVSPEPRAEDQKRPARGAGAPKAKQPRQSQADHRKADADGPSPEGSPTEQLEALRKQVLKAVLGRKRAVEQVFSAIPQRKRRAFLAALAVTGTRVRAAKLAGIDRGCIYTRQWREDALFQEGLKLAEQMAGDLYEDEVHRRAVEGTWRPTGWYQGTPGGYVREFSDLLLMFRTKAIFPDKYRERMDIRSASIVFDMKRCNDEQVARIAAGEHPLVVMGGGSTPALGPAPTGAAQPQQQGSTPRGEDSDAD